MDSKSVELYKQALEEGKEEDHTIRIMVVGHYGVGKTALTKRLLCQEVDVNERSSTDGIDVHVERCKVSLTTDEWTVDLPGISIVEPVLMATSIKQAICIKQACIQFQQKANTLKSTYIKEALVLSKHIFTIP